MTFLAKDMKNTHYLVNQGYPVNLVDNQFSKPSIILRQDLLKQTFRASKKDFSFKFMVIISTFVITFNPTRPNLNCIIKKTATFFGVLILKIPSYKTGILGTLVCFSSAMRAMVVNAISCVEHSVGYQRQKAEEIKDCVWKKNEGAWVCFTTKTIIIIIIIFNT